MMFMFHTTMGILFLALVASVALYIWSAREHGAGSGLGKFTGIIVAIIILLNIICTGYTGIKLWKEGFFQMPMKMMAKDHNTTGQAPNNPTTH